MIYILLEQTQNERGRITPAFKKLVYDAFGKDNQGVDSFNRRNGRTGTSEITR